MTAQIANGGYKIYPKIVANDDNQYAKKINLRHYIKISKNIKNCSRCNV